MWLHRLGLRLSLGLALSLPFSSGLGLGLQLRRRLIVGLVCAGFFLELESLRIGQHELMLEVFDLLLH